MCDPISALMVAATATQAAGQIQSGLYASKVARNQAYTAAQNKGLAREAALDALGRGQEEQRRLGREVAQRVGSQEARIGANNIDVSTGSAARTIEDTRLIGAEDSATISENTARRVREMQTDIWSLETERRAAKSEQRQAKVATAFGVASTVLGGAVQYEKFRKDRGG